jgi:hypothetical protein
MTPKRKADDDDAHAARPRHTPTHDSLKQKLRTSLIFVIIFAALFLLHLPLINLPYYWDEAGYFIPAAYDIYTGWDFIPHSTLSNAHPPLLMTYLALMWKLFGFHIAVARVGVLAVSALALAGVFRLSERVANTRVAAATVLSTALYPVFFAQSSLAHLDMLVTALTVWGLVFYLPPRALRATQGETISSRDGATSLQGDTATESRDATTLQDAATALRDDATPLQGTATPLQTDTTSLQGDATTLQPPATPLQGSATPLRDDAITLQSGANAARALERPVFRRVFCVFLFALAALAKETAVLVPLTLFGWELLCLLAGKNERLASVVCVERRSLTSSFALLLPCVPLALWLTYHHAHTGYFFGNPEYFRYNVESTLDLARILETLWRRLAQVTYHMNLWALTLAGVAAMFLKPRRDRIGDKTLARPRIALPVQLMFAALIVAHVFALSIVGGAVLARYMLPVLPLVVLIWVSTVWRRVPAFALAVALVCGAFAYRIVVNPTYAVPWEENLAYRDFILVHRDAARFLAEHYADARVLTTWPATDELKNPYFGYTPRTLRVFSIKNFLPDALERAAQQKSEYDVALLFTTHGGPNLEEAARTLGGRVVFSEEKNGQWAAVVEK